MKAALLILAAVAFLGLAIFGQAKIVNDCGWQAAFTKDINTYWLLGGCKH